MATFALIHGAGDTGGYWHLVAERLRAGGHVAVAADLPVGDDRLTLDDYADEVVTSVGDCSDLVVVGQSFGAFTVPLVAARRPVRALVLVAGMIPAPGESPDEWWTATGYREAAHRQAVRDGGLTGSDDPYDVYFHDVPRPLAEEAMSRERAPPAASAQPWPLDAWPDVPTGVVVGTRDRLFPADFLRRLAAERLGVVPTGIDAGHCVALSRPVELAQVLAATAG